jgi:hypothetical protein
MRQIHNKVFKVSKKKMKVSRSNCIKFNFGEYNHKIIYKFGEYNH